MSAGYKLLQTTVTVTTAGTRVPLKTGNGLYTQSVEISAASTNVGDVYIGPDSVASTTALGLSPGETTTINAPMVSGTHGDIDLSQIYVDADNNGDKIFITYLARVN